MIPNTSRRIICVAACLASALPLLGQVPSGGMTAAASAVFDLSNAGQTIPAHKAAADPATCVVGEQYFNTTSNVVKDCTAANTWTAALNQATAQAGTPWKCVDAGSSGTISSSGPAAITIPPLCCPRWRGRSWI